MDALRQEIERKRKALADRKLVGPERKYFKRDDLIKKEEEEYWEKHRSKIEPGTSSEDHDVAAPSAYTSVVKNDGEEERILNRKEVIRRLRERGEPVLLFGENELAAYNRLSQLELLEPELNRGLRNDFQEAMERVDQAYLNEILKSGTTGTDRTKEGKAHDVKIMETNTTIEEIKSLASNLGKRKDDIKQDCETVLTFLRFLLELWGKKLNARPEAEKMSTPGKIASATYSQTQSYLKHLFKQLKTNKVAVDILKHLVLIVKFLLDRDYVKASDAYLQMAIGNSPWPIGVTMVGIHARTGREKIFSQNIAHVLNDETQRKYIQGLKRLMTHCQRFFPTDPSRCVEYNA